MREFGSYRGDGCVKAWAHDRLLIRQGKTEGAFTHVFALLPSSIASRVLSAIKENLRRAPSDSQQVLSTVLGNEASPSTPPSGGGFEEFPQNTRQKTHGCVFIFPRDESSKVQARDALCGGVKQILRRVAQPHTNTHTQCYDYRKKSISTAFTWASLEEVELS